MLTFKPIIYSDDDMRAFKYKSGESVREGAFAKIAASSTRSTVACTLANETLATIPLAAGAGSLCVMVPGMYFPIYREDPDIENVGATIARNDFVIGMHLRPGSEFEIHRTALWQPSHTTLGSFAAIGGFVALGTAGKLGPWQAHNMGANVGANAVVVVGVVTGTYANKWLRVRCI